MSVEDSVLKEVKSRLFGALRNATPSAFGSGTASVTQSGMQEGLSLGDIAEAAMEAADAMLRKPKHEPCLALRGRREVHDQLCRLLRDGRSGLSGSAMVFGDQSETLRLVNTAISSTINDFISNDINAAATFTPRIAVLPCGAAQNQGDALLSLVGRCLNRKQGDHHYSSALEDLEETLSLARSEGFPAILVLEDVHYLAQERRQTMLYTLLDLTQRSDLLFLMIGVTSRADIYVKLEKRVLSRLNARYLYLSGMDGEEACKELIYQLSLAEDPTLSPAAAGYGAKLNESVIAAFGKFEIVDAASEDFESSPTTTMAINKSLHNERLLREDLSHGRYSLKCISPGHSSDLIALHMAWGRSYSFLELLVWRLLVGLRSDAPIITREAIESVISCQEPPSLAEILSTLSSHELILYSGLARRQCGQEDGNPHETTVDAAFDDFDKLSQTLSRGALSIGRVTSFLQTLVYSGLVTVWTGGKGVPADPANFHTSLDPSAIVVVRHHADEIRAAYKVTPSVTTLNDGPNHKRPKLLVEPNVGGIRPPVLLAMPERIRQAVLDPLSSLTIRPTDLGPLL